MRNSKDYFESSKASIPIDPGLLFSFDSKEMEE